MTERRLRTFSLLVFMMLVRSAQAQHIESFGVFMGMNFPFTIDQGLQKDTRFYGKFTMRATPVGFSYGYDKVGHGFVVTPALTKIGQKYVIRNIQGGEVGERDISMNYLSVPVALKIHLNDLAFFRLSIVACGSVDYLLSGTETFTHDAAKLRYPAGVIIPTDPGYTKVYDGVFVPQVDRQVYVAKDKFKALQVSAGVGFRSDFDFSDNWSMNFDGRAMFGIFDPRKQSYLNELKAGSSTNPSPDLYGQRRDVYLYATIGISRIFQIKQQHQPKVSSRPSGMSKPVKRKPRNK